MQIEDIDFNEDVDFSTIEEEIHIAKDMFVNMAEFIDSEAEQYGEISFRKAQRFQNCSWCCCVFFRAESGS